MITTFAIIEENMLLFCGVFFSKRTNRIPRGLKLPQWKIHGIVAELREEEQNISEPVLSHKRKIFAQRDRGGLYFKCHCLGCLLCGCWPERWLYLPFLLSRESEPIATFAEGRDLVYMGWSTMNVLFKNFIYKGRNNYRFATCFFFW